MDRRNFIRDSLIGAASISAALIPTDFSRADRKVSPVSTGIQTSEFVDVNTYLSRWPFRRIPYDEPAELVEMLRSRGVVEAWAGSFEGLFYKDMAGVNARLAETCQQYGKDLLVPIGSVNPRLPNWQRDLQRIDEEHGMPGVRLHPGYHNYSMDESVVADFFEEAARRELLVQIVPWMQDERHHNPLMPVPTPETDPVAELAARFPELTIMILNGFRSGNNLGPVADAANVLVDFAKLDVVTALGGYLERIPAERIVFGSYAPMFYFESAALKLHETSLSETELSLITHRNARRVLNT
jgi:predicted TIM-barrel fold metal-dependent hydrolase